MFWESGAGYNSENRFSLDSIFSTNGCVGTNFMDVGVCMHISLKPNRERILCMWVQTLKKKIHNILGVNNHTFNMPKLCYLSFF